MCVALIGCKSKSRGEPVGSTEEWQSQVTERELPEEGLLQQEVDLDIDGRPEIINYYRERATDRLLVKKELDLNQDGRIDLVSFFDDEGRLKKEEMDSDYDGKFDWTDHYRDGKRVMSEYDTETDGVSNVFKYYETVEGQTRLSRKERDTNGDGKIDVWERFDAEGNVIRTGTDTDGDGKMDERSE
ncbi:MAG: hypothetical protein R3F61_15845 [Myxococcota bacterium]